MTDKMTTMKQFHWFWAWDDEKEEQWLREMAQKGWHFESVALPGFYTFAHGEPRDDVYRLDYFTDSKDFANYLLLFMDAGWEYKGAMSGWQYFRKTTVNGDVPEIFSDAESKSKKYQRILLLLVALMPIFIFNVNNLNRMPGTLAEIVTFISFLFLLFFIYAIARLGMRINQLRKKV
jgi:hypothetical protein